MGSWRLEKQWYRRGLCSYGTMIKLFSDIDSELFEECLLKFQEDEAQKEEIKLKHEATWKRLEEIVAMKAVSNQPVLWILVLILDISLS
ncbi:hypothetical protein U1Q18_004176 [Sarracenia purpurea var. burkii]